MSRYSVTPFLGKPAVFQWSITRTECIFEPPRGKTMWFPNRSDTNRPVQLHKQVRSLKFWSSVEEELYYPSSENKGADHLSGYREADLRLCFRLCRLLVFPWGGSFLSPLTDISYSCSTKADEEELSSKNILFDQIFMKDV